MKKANLVSMPTLVESPFIIATIGGYTFGSYIPSGLSYDGLHTKVNFPNYMKSLKIIKVNGTVNTYTLNFVYHVSFGEDPNKLDKIFSRAAIDRKITLSYGDWNAPAFIYKEETGIITKVTSSLDMANATINYTVNCTSDAIGLTSTKFNFPAVHIKGSEQIMKILSNARYGFKKVFTGMKNKQDVLANNLIASNDKEVDLLAQKNMSPLEYLNYVVSCMEPATVDSSDGLYDSAYFLTIHDDLTNNLGGTYFKVNYVKETEYQKSTVDTYVLDVNYPSDNFVTQFSLTNDQSWAILYKFSDELEQETKSYRINDEGKLTTYSAPSLIRSYSTGGVSASCRSWWSKMTSFPIQATLTLKGLTRPSILMTYVKLNVWFHGGQKHVSSGLYIITKQEDSIDASGYRTTLTLLRVGEDA